MNPRRHIRPLVAFAMIAGLLPVTAGTVIAAMSAGSIQGQEGWSGGTIAISAAVDQAVHHPIANAHTGVGAWRVSNSTINGNFNGQFAGWPFGPGLSVSAGQPSSGAGADQFGATLWFRAANASADGSNIEIDLGSVAGDDRNSFLALTNDADADGGLQLRASEPDGATGDFYPTQKIATGISRNDWHRLDILANFQNGSANDTLAYTLDGVLLANPLLLDGTTFGTFEGFREGRQFPYLLSNRLMFRSGAVPSAFDSAFVDNAAQGFYFDDLYYFVAGQSPPAITLAGYATGFEPSDGSPDLTIVKSHAGQFRRGQTGTWTIGVINRGYGPTAGQVTVEDWLPAGILAIGVDAPGWACANLLGLRVTCTRADPLGPGAPYPPINIRIRPTFLALPMVTNSARVSGGGDTGGLPNLASETATVAR